MRRNRKPLDGFVTSSAVFVHPSRYTPESLFFNTLPPPLLFRLPFSTTPPLWNSLSVNLLLSQRKTPTVIHPGYKISRIRSFYMRKVKFTQETISERLGAIIGDFPRLDVSRRLLLQFASLWRGRNGAGMPRHAVNDSLSCPLQLTQALPAIFATNSVQLVLECLLCQSLLDLLQMTYNCSWNTCYHTLLNTSS